MKLEKMSFKEEGWGTISIFQAEHSNTIELHALYAWMRSAEYKHWYAQSMPSKQLTVNDHAWFNGSSELHDGAAGCPQAQLVDLPGPTCYEGSGSSSTCCEISTARVLLGTSWESSKTAASWLWHQQRQVMASDYSKSNKNLCWEAYPPKKTNYDGIWWDSLSLSLSVSGCLTISIYQIQYFMLQYISRLGSGETLPAHSWWTNHDTAVSTPKVSRMDEHGKCWPIAVHQAGPVEDSVLC